MARWDVPAETIGALLARARAEQGLSQLRLAQRLCDCAGVPTVTRHEVSRWEREQRIPSDYWLNWLAIALDVPLAELVQAAAVARRRRTLRQQWVEVAAGVHARAG